MLTAATDAKKTLVPELEMFSRVGKRTKSQYLVFNKEKRDSHHFMREVEEVDEDIDDLLNERERTDVEKEIKKIRDSVR